MSIKQLFIVLLLVGGFSYVLSSQKEHSTDINDKTNHVTVIVGTASWCPICKTNGPRIKGEIIPAFQNDSQYSIYIYNLSDEASINNSLDKMKDPGLQKFAKKHPSASGVIYFINPKSNALIQKISVTEPNEKIIQVFKEVLTKI
jgi:thiol-disulfide isomerase/thioredoxin